MKTINNNKTKKEIKMKNLIASFAVAIAVTYISLIALVSNGTFSSLV